MGLTYNGHFTVLADSGNYAAQYIKLPSIVYFDWLVDC